MHDPPPSPSAAYHNNPIPNALPYSLPEIMPFLQATFNRRMSGYSVLIITAAIWFSSSSNERISSLSCSSFHFKYEAQTALFKDPVRTAQ